MDKTTCIFSSTVCPAIKVDLHCGNMAIYSRLLVAFVVEIVLWCLCCTLEGKTELSTWYRKTNI